MEPSIYPGHRLLKRLEIFLMAGHYFPVQESLSVANRIKLLLKYLIFRITPESFGAGYEISFFIYSKSCERMLLPLILGLLRRAELKGKIKVHVIVIESIYHLELASSNIEQLQRLGCRLESDHLSLIRACRRPAGKLAVMCLDHRRIYSYHYCGVDTADRLRNFSVKTLSMQHGGTRADSIEDLASAACDTLLIWGERACRELTRRHGVDPLRVRVVGNPLHDRLSSIDREQVLRKLLNRHPLLKERLPNKKVALLATCLHSEYEMFEDEEAMYDAYVKHICGSMDFSQAVLIIKMHPLDKRSPNLYLRAARDACEHGSVFIVEADDADLDVYCLLSISDFLITRASTVAEEALLLGKKVIAFDMLPEGPSREYRHLSDYGDYTNVYAEPANALSLALSESLARTRPAEKPTSRNVEADLTYRLDGNSVHRAVNEILRELFGTSDGRPLPG
jgi:hypothetical protein